VTDDTIAAIDVAPLELVANPRLAVRGSLATHDRSSLALVRLTTSSGATGYGEVTASPYWSGEDAVTAAHFMRTVIRATLVGRALAPVPALSARLDGVLARNEFTKAGVNMAAWDALGRLEDKPVATLLGGIRRSSVATKITLSGDGPVLEACLSEARARGFRAYKVKVGFEPRQDAARLTHARELVGDAFLGVDANGGWTRADARSAMTLMEAARPAFVEQPVRARDLYGLAEVRRTTDVPVIADESIYDLDDLDDAARTEACDAVSVYVGKSGGLERAVALLDDAARRGLGGIVGSNGEVGPGVAAQVHVACAAQAVGPFPSDVIGHHFYDSPGVLEAPVEIDGAEAHLPGGPGLGVRPIAELEAAFS